MIPKPLTPEEDEEMARLVEIAEERAWTAEEAKRYYMLLGYPEDWAAYFVENGGMFEER